MLKLYHVRGTRSVRPLWLCYELELAVEVVAIDFSPEYRNSPEYRAISPAGKVPALTDGELTMFESGAMVDYLLERYGNGRLRPAPGTSASALYHQWCWFSEATLLRPLGLSGLVRAGAGDAGDLAAEGLEKTRTCLAVVDAAVADRDFLLGSAFTGADVMMGYALALIRQLKLLDERYPGAATYLARLETRAAYQRATRA